MWSRSCFAAVTADGEVSRPGAEVFRGSDRDLLLALLRCPKFLRCLTADISLFVSDGPISFNSERNGGKNAGKNCVFAFPHALCPAQI